MPNDVRSELGSQPQTAQPTISGEAAPGPGSGRRVQLALTALVVLAVLGALGWLGITRHRAANKTRVAGVGMRSGSSNSPVPVVLGTVEQKDVPIYLDGLGTVQAFNTVTVRSRVDGQVQKIAFVEGQDVHAGELLAQIDPAPFQAQLNQNVAKLAQDEAQLSVARLTLKRDGELLASKILAQQDYDTQQALVEQLAAALKGDQAAIDSAKVQLNYTTITSPLDGRTGIRLVDQGNIIHAGDSNGLVVITQLRPISITFTLPEQKLSQIRPHLAAGETLTTLATDRENHILSQGKLAVVDNQIDISTGTIRLKATFPNDELKLWPGQFVNARLLIATRIGGAVVPASVVQQGPQGTFAFVVATDQTAQIRPIKVAQTEQGQALIDEGLRPGERVVVDGQYKLQKGFKVKPVEPESAAPRSAAAGGDRGAKASP